jgi:preprotein translocase subunit SecG
MQVLNIFHVLIAIAMVAFVLVQRGSGATAGAAFGSGASGTVFGSRGAGSFLSRTTWVLATLFGVISLTMAIMVSRTVATPEQDLGVIGTQQAPVAVEVDAFQDLPALDDTDQDSDIPVLDTGSDISPQGDLPALDNESEPVTDQADGASDDETGDGPGDG